MPKLAGSASIIGDTYIANALVASYCMYSTWSVVGCGSGISPGYSGSAVFDFFKGARLRFQAIRGASPDACKFHI